MASSSFNRSFLLLRTRRLPVTYCSHRCGRPQRSLRGLANWTSSLSAGRRGRVAVLALKRRQRSSATELDDVGRRGLAFLRDLVARRPGPLPAGRCCAQMRLLGSSGDPGSRGTGAAGPGRAGQRPRRGYPVGGRRNLGGSSRADYARRSMDSLRRTLRSMSRPPGAWPYFCH